MLANEKRDLERAALYEILASHYLQLPSVENVINMPTILQEADIAFPEIELEELVKEANERKKIVEENSENIKILQQQYYDHFFIPSTANYIPIFEASVRGALKSQNKRGKREKQGWKYGSLWGQETYHVGYCYEAVGFNPSQLNMYESLKQCKVPDHLGFELAFVAYLCDAEGKVAFAINEAKDDQLLALSEKKKQWNDLQTQFLQEHVDKFVTRCYDISMEKANPFYLSLIKAVHRYVKWDLACR